MGGEVFELVKWAKQNGFKNAHIGMDKIHGNGYFIMATGKEKFEIYKQQYSLVEKSLKKAVYPVGKENALYNLIRESLHHKVAYTDNERKTWQTYATEEEVIDAIRPKLLEDFTNHFKAEKLKIQVDHITKYGIIEEIEKVRNEEFIRGRILICVDSNDKTFFEITKGDEVRKLTIEEFINAHLKNWIKAIDEQREAGKKLAVLQNAFLGFSELQYKYPQAETEIARAVKRLTGIESYLKQGKVHKQRKPKSYPQYLMDIWQGTTEQYNNVIGALKNEYAPIGAPFIEEIMGKFTWNRNPKKGFAQYIKGFLYVCIDKGWIKKNQYSANQFRIIIKNTFNIEVNLEPFKDMHTPPLKTYSKPFQNMPKNNNSLSS